VDNPGAFACLADSLAPLACSAPHETDLTLEVSVGLVISSDLGGQIVEPFDKRVERGKQMIAPNQGARLGVPDRQQQAHPAPDLTDGPSQQIALESPNASAADHQLRPSGCLRIEP
jgi:hypothetical protein